MKIIELLYKEGRVFFYAIDEKTAFIFGTSKAEAPTMHSTESEGWSLVECQHVVFQALRYEIEARMRADKSLVKLYNFGNIKEEDRAGFFHKLVEIATE